MRRTSAALLIVVTALLPVVVFAASDVESLQEAIRQKQEAIDRLQEQAKRYQTSLEQKRRESRTFANQLAILGDNIEETRLGIAAGETTIEKTNLEISGLELAVTERERNLAEMRRDLGTMLRTYNRLSQRSPLQIFFTSRTFADFFNELRTFSALQRGMNDTIGNVEKERAELTSAKQAVEERRTALAEEVEDLTNRKADLEDQQDLKAYYLQQTKSSEQRFAALLEDAKREQAAVTREISALERQVRERLRAEGVATNGEAPTLVWPVPKNKITTFFRDPTYPLRHLFEHDGIDIRAGQGTPVRAAASGYVARARTGDPSRYWYVMLVHEGNQTTIYGHLSRIVVAANTFVAQGQIIGYSGGRPGSPGAGPFSTGPHLHFELYQNGKAINPLPSLP